ncbi:MAG: hypothetical protein KDI18_11260 [Gammaproteobacteria bacterium]|nr:hypothetical protein [Gammaproteobacteria bacterium]MCB1904641.1 hypothetical protein [Gammaproteobacteria bacterium]
MYTGTQALGSIDGALHTAQSQINQLEQTIEQTTQRLLALEREEIDRFRDLARIRVDLLASGEIISHLDESERTTARILEERTEGQAKLAQEMRESEARQQSLERMRSEQSQRVEQAETLLDQREAETQQRLQADADYQRQLQIAQQAERVAKHAEEKTELALADRQEKGEPYQQDALFIYLWQRRYGTSEYRANPLTRALDDWVAGLCGYADARANYAMLNEIPQRLQEHSEQVRTQAKIEFEKLAQLELQAAEADGIPALQQALTTSRNALAELDDQLAEQQKRDQELLHRNDEYAAGEDRYFAQATQYLAAELRRDDIMELHRDARLTPTPEDDVVIGRIMALRSDKQHIEQNLERHRTLLKTQRERISELESLRLEFKRQRYDGSSSVFADGTLVGMMLNEFLKGVLSRDGLWQEIRRQHSRRTTHSNPDFGTGGFSRRRSTWGSGGSWGGLGGRGGGGLGGGGGFKTGGGF